jgi:Rhodopirellula transposase DDE domain
MEVAIGQRFAGLSPLWDERRRRLWAAAEAKAVGYGGVSLVSRATGLSRRAIHVGLNELAAGATSGRPAARVRRPGAGRKPLTVTQPGLRQAVEALVEPTCRGDPGSPLRWTCKGVRRLAAALRGQGFRVSHQKVAELLRDLGYSLQANRKTREGSQHPDRDAQFEYLAARVRDFQARGQPVISVDTKKKELVGDFKNGGREWHPAGKAPQVRVHDFMDKTLGKAIPYGVYDVTANAGWVSVGSDHDTADFAAATIGRWWQEMGRPLYPRAAALLITADSGGSNGSRCRRWKVALQRLADELRLAISVCHLPPGTSKWNKIEHRLFSQIAVNWRGRPLTSHEVVVQLIANTRTETGLRVRAACDRNRYPTGIKVTDQELAAVNLRRDEFHGEWNYTISPVSKTQ